MRNGLWRHLGMLLGACVLLFLPVRSHAQPAQKLPSALLVFPLLQSDGNYDTRIEMLNLTGLNVEVQCFYIRSDSCLEVGFFFELSPHQPVAWLASQGNFIPFSSTAIPPFYGEGELKCGITASRPEVEFQNAIQGRATVFAQNGQTVSYGATAFRRLTDGSPTGIFNLNGSTYTPCPNKLHFQVMTDETLPNDLVLVTCDEDLITQTPKNLNVQFQVINEFEQAFSASIGFQCFDRRPLSEVSSFFTRSVLGTDTAHVILRGVGGGVLGLGIDAIDYGGSVRTAGNEGLMEGGRSATVKFPVPTFP